ncbi:rod shape-determining protein MreC [Solicola gregarius]|uniref:Cell shape-determining protein MreC n=1 Tax=Solicola gregarius TaxID=2908642 RepID=A0AA46TGW9_9ACTN|nr:rod shape-determining protein MreC [Solicola gregarius]UYM04313.1 rod shape-determining protein MreC [Solicola gregarius]
MRNHRDDERARTILVLLVLASISVISIDAGSGSDSPVDPVRTATGSVVGPVQSGFSAATRPMRDLGDTFTSDETLRDENTALEKENAELRSRLRSAGADTARASELERVNRVAREAGFETVSANVVGYESAQSFGRTVTIDEGTASGITNDMTVLNSDGLVGRVVDASPNNATVLLIIDSDSVVGGRLGSSMELGFLTGDGDLSGDARLSMDALDETAKPEKGDSVVTWGSRKGVPYVAGVPIGEVADVDTDPRNQSSTARVEPYVDFSALDVVTVVVGSGASDDKTEAAGEER